MTETATSPPALLRLAGERDVPAILCLVLTSFRQFSLFRVLYEPIQHDPNYAWDTVFFWRRRLLLALLDPDCSVVVAEVPLPGSSRSDGPAEANDDETVAGTAPSTTFGGSGDGSGGGGGGSDESFGMHRWLTHTAHLSQDDRRRQTRIVGFAIWRTRATDTQSPTGWVDWIRTKWIAAELAVYGQFYRRKDLDRPSYEAYSQSEDELEERFYTGPCWYLDNLAVDFRHRRRGVGRALVQWGLDRTPPGLPAMTESGPMAEQLYRTLGFTVAGTWTVPLPARTMSFPVLRWTKPADPNVQE